MNLESYPDSVSRWVLLELKNGGDEGRMVEEQMENES